jgi:hypothetical protein
VSLKTASAEEIKERLGKTDSTKYSVKHQELERIDTLSKGDNDTMTDLQDQEIIAFALIRSLHQGLQRKTMDQYGDDKIVGGLPMTMHLLDNLRGLRISRGRQGRKEFIEALRARTPNYMVPQYDQEEKRPGFFARIIDRLRGRRQEDNGS